MEQQTANFFFPPESLPPKYRLGSNRKLVPKQQAEKQQIQTSIPSTTDKKSTSKPNSAQSNLHDPLTPPQKTSWQNQTRSDEKKPNNYRIFSSNINQRSSYPNETQQQSFGFQHENEFLNLGAPIRPSGVLSPSKQLTKLPEIFHRVQKNSSQGFRIQSGNPKRDTQTNFELPKPRQVKLPAVQQQGQAQHGVPFLQTKGQRKLINRIFSGKKDL